ncbi:peptidase S8/S53 domain-containing protein [Xylaria cf. heliscus]|nr:peptidase S8/S53 domain-containing protein [Xylaria cf. heliscus]
MPQLIHPTNGVVDEKRKNQLNPSLNGLITNTRDPIKVTSRDRRQITEIFVDHARKYEWHKQEERENANIHFSNFESVLNPNEGSGIFFALYDRYLGWDKCQVEGFVNWIGSGRYRGLLTQKDPHTSGEDFSRTPLIVAIDKKEHNFVAALLKVEGISVDTFYKVNGYGTCLHQGIKKKSTLIELMVQKYRKYPDLYLEVDNKGNNVLHLLAQTRGEEMLAPYLENIVGLKRGPENEAVGSADERPGGNDNMELNDGSADDLEESKFDTTQFRLNVLQQIMEISHIVPVLQQNNKAHQTPYQLRVSTLKASEEVNRVLGQISDPKRNLRFRNKIGLDKLREQALRKIIDADPVAQLIRRTCIRRFNSSHECSKALYQLGDERHIDFNLAELTGDSISRDYLDNLAGHIHFETILRYVALPNLVVRPSKRATSTIRMRPGFRAASEHSSPNIDNSEDEPTDLRAIFSWLRENGVREIVRVTVIDYGDTIHSDSAIKVALKNFEVEFWNWKKVDLCSQVIEECSHIVKEVSLYWSGNYAVMMGWASSEGFINKDKFPELETIRLFIKEGYEDRTILNRQIQKFRTQMVKRKQDVTENEIITQFADKSASHSPAIDLTVATSVSPDTTKDDKCINVVVVYDNMEFSHAKDFESIETYRKDGNTWISSVEDLTCFLLNHEEETVSPIKIAILDDGLDATVPELQNAIALGKSFSPYPNSTEFMKAYFLPSGRHGTLMATLIRKICPKPEIYIARLEEYFDKDGRARYTATSAKEAIAWARGCKVDIILMSWAINAWTPPYDTAFSQLDEELKKAADDGILMFASARDQGEVNEEHLFPGIRGSDCIRVGAASDEGDKLTGVNQNWVHFLVPGKEIGFYADGSGSYFTETGSWLANACAAGLAGALLFADRVLGVDKRTRDLRSTVQMKQMLKGLSGRNDHPYVDARSLEILFKKELNAKGQQKGGPMNISEVDWHVGKEALRKALDTVWNKGG